MIAGAVVGTGAARMLSKLEMRRVTRKSVVFIVAFALPSDWQGLWSYYVGI